MIFDTDVLIWALRGYPLAIEVVDEADERYVSIATNLELVHRVRNKRELRDLRSYLRAFALLPTTEDIGRRALQYMEDLALKIAVDPMDALIAATAVEHNLVLCTGNVKHFRDIPQLKVSPFNPLP